MKTSQKGFIVPLLLAIIALLLAGGAYVYLQKNQTNQPITASSTTQTNSTTQASNQTDQASSVTQTTSSQTADWKTYTNNNFGLRIQYPNKEFNVKETTIPTYLLWVSIINPTIISGDDSPAISFSAKIFDSQKSLTSYVQDLYGKEYVSFESVPINGVTWLKLILNNTHATYDNYFYLQDGILYHLWSFSAADNPDISRTLNEMILTTKLNPKQTQFSGWKTYSNYGFQIQYPPDAIVNDVDISGGRSISFQQPGSNSSMVINVVTQSWNGGVLKAPANCNDFDSGVVTSTVGNGLYGFTKGDISNQFNGMNSSSDAREYCVLHGDTAYKIITRIMFGHNEARPNADDDPVLNQMFISFKFNP